MSDSADSDDSDDSNTAFDVEIEKYEKRLQFARYRKKYRNTWKYITNRWHGSRLTTVLEDMEKMWRVYSDDSDERYGMESISFWRYLKDLYYVNNTAIDNEDELYLHLHLRQEYLDVLEKRTCVCSEKDLKSMRNSLHVDMMAVSEYIEFFEEVAEVNYGHEANAIYVRGGMHDLSMRSARIQYGHTAYLLPLDMQLISNNFSSLRSDRQLKEKFMNSVVHSLPAVQCNVSPLGYGGQKLEAPDTYTLECMKFAFARIHRKFHLPQDIWQIVLYFLFKKQTVEHFNERCKVARQLKKVEDLLRNFRLGYAGHYDEKRRRHKLMYDVYKSFMRDLHSKHDKLQQNVEARLIQMNELLEKFKCLPAGGKLRLPRVLRTRI